MKRICTASSVTSMDGTSIGYLQLGQGPGVVLVHGGMESAQNKIELAEALAAEYTVYVPDRRGRGLSGPYGSDYCIQKDVDDVEALLAKTGAHHLFGFSSGALIALQAALTLPAIQKAAIWEPPLSVNGSVPMAWTSRFDQEIAQGKHAAALVTVGKGLQMWGHRLPRWLFELMANKMIDGGDKQAAGPTMRELIPTMKYDGQLVLEMADQVGRFRAMSAEVLLLGGSKSPGYLKLSLGALEQVLPHVRRVEFPGLNHGGAGNSSMGGQPERVADELRRFFQ